METNENIIDVPKRIYILIYILIFILGLSLVSNIFFFQRISPQQKANEENITEINNLIRSQRTEIKTLLTRYENAAYDNPLIDRIAEQQLIASEFTLDILQIIAEQNLQIIDLLANY